MRGIAHVCPSLLSLTTHIPLARWITNELDRIQKQTALSERTLSVSEAAMALVEVAAPLYQL